MPDKLDPPASTLEAGLDNSHDIFQPGAPLLAVEQARLLELVSIGRPLGECLDAVTSSVAKLGAGIRACIMLADPSRTSFLNTYGSEIPPSFGAGLKNAPINDLCIGTCGEAVFRAAPVSCTDIAKDVRWSEAWRELCVAHGILACHSQPIVGRDGQCLASLMMCFASAHEPTSEEVAISEFGARIAAIAIEQDRSVEELRRSQHRLSAELADAELLQEISVQILGGGTVEELYEKILDGAVQLMRSDYASMQMLHPGRGSGGELELLAFRGFNPEAAHFWTWVRADSESTCGMALRTGKRAIVPDVEKSDDMAGSEDLATYLQTGIHAVQTTPLISRSGRLLGMLSTHWREVYEPTEGDLRRLDVLARQAADLIERSQAEAHLQRLNEELSERVESAVAAREAAASQIHELQKLETIGQLTGGIAHDFNNLLTPIVGALDILRRRYNVDERADRMIGAAQESAERARVLVGRLLSFARRQHLDPQPVNLSELVLGMTDLIDRSLGPQVDIRRELDPSVSAVLADPNQLELAILNLCVNARDAMPDGGQLVLSVAEVHLGEGESLPHGLYVRLSVADTGVGMDPQTLKRAVEPFYTTKGVGRGTGLGLSSVHGLAAQSGGELRLHSKTGAGTVAEILLPRVDGVALSKRVVGTAPLVESEPLRILLVDDEELVRAGTAEMLEALGHSVVQFGSGGAALQRLQGDLDVDLLVTDYMMPSMTGAALARELRTVRPEMPVVLITGFTGLNLSDTDLVRLAKPFGAAELSAAIAAARAC